MKKTFYLMLILLIGLTACSTAPQNDSWPRDIPPRDYFIDYWEQDPAHMEVTSLSSYLMWVKRFYMGWELYRNGWRDTMQRIGDSVTVEEQKTIALDKLYLMGQLVSAEWAKESGYRVINTRHLSIWGNTLKRSTEEGNQIAIIDILLNDVNNLLEGDLTPSEIKKKRYQKEDYEEEPFGGEFE